jgi:rhodanese-related sulfurtransferase
MSAAIQADPVSAVNRISAAAPEIAAEHFRRRLAFEADVSDVHHDLEAGIGDFVVVDTRSDAAWAQGHIAGAVHLPTDSIPYSATESIDQSKLVVTYCWGPGCNGATRAAHAFATLGYRVKEMLGGYEYWVREGFPVVTAEGTRRTPADPLTAPAGGIACNC